MMLPYLVRKTRSTGSRAAKFFEDFMSQKMFPKMGMVGGLGGSFLFRVNLRVRVRMKVYKEMEAKT